MLRRGYIPGVAPKRGLYFLLKMLHGNGLWVLNPLADTQWMRYFCELLRLALCDAPLGESISKPVPSRQVMVERNLLPCRAVQARSSARRAPMLSFSR